MSLLKSARTVVKTCLNLKISESVLIITDKKRIIIGKAIAREAEKITKNVKLKLIPVPKIHGTEPPKETAKEMLNYDIIIAPTTMSLTHTNAVKKAGLKGARIATLPGITKSITEILDIDYKKMRIKAQRLKKILDKKKKIHLTTPSGTDLRFEVKKRRWITDIGLIHNSGDIGNLPAGEVFIAPDEGKTNGIIVIDSLKDGNKTYARKGTKVKIKNGHAEKVFNSKCQLARLFKQIKNGTNIAELGIGINEKATKIKGNILHDEKMIKTTHLAFGSNAGIGGKIYAKMHLDTIIINPTLYADNKIIMDRGRLLT